MTVASTTASISYTYTGATSVFAVPFYFIANADLLVRHKVALTGVVSSLVLNSDYTVTGAGDSSGGSITVGATLANNDTIEIERAVALVQPTSYAYNGPFSSSSTEQSLDRTVMQLQTLELALSRALLQDPLTTLYDAGGNRLTNLANGVNPTDAATVAQIGSGGGGGGGGTVSSVALADYTGLFTITGSPITTTGTINLTLASQAANHFFAAPYGGAGAPSMRLITPADVPVFIASGASHAAGLVPDPGSTAGTTRYLREDSTWDVPGGSGIGTVTSVSVVTANGFTGTVANATSTPAITLTTDVIGILYGNGTALLTAVPNNFPTLNQDTTGNAATVTTNANLTGPVTSVGNATTIAANVVTNGMLAQMAANTIKGNNTGAAANAADLTPAQINVMLPVFTSVLAGLVPASGGGTTNFLRADGTFAAPGGTGGTVTSVALSDGSGTFTVSGSPITGAGTLALALAAQSANTFLAGPTSGSAAASAFRSISGLDIQLPANNHFFTQNGAIIERLNDRVFVGGATACSGDFPQSTNDWFSAFYDANGYTGYSLTAMLCVETNTDPNSAQGGLFAAQSLHFTGTGPVAIGVSAIAIGNGTYASNAYGIYAEAHRISSATNAVYAAEVDTHNTVNAPTAPTPYTQGNVVGVQIASGAGVSATGQFNASAAIQIESNPMTFDVGINFGSTSITGATGTSGTGIALALGYGHVIQWYNSTGNQIGSFYSAVTTVADATNLVFTNNGLTVTNYLGSALLYIAPTVSPVNPITLTAAATGVDPSIAVTSGSDTNIGLQLITKGTGLLKFGTFTTGAPPAATGTIAIMDSSGTLRSLHCN